jgi:drug/metabolite transporter (DMT)-like permease
MRRMPARPIRVSLPLLAGLIAAALFGAATPASKALLATLSPFQLAGLLYLGAAVGVLPLLIRGRSLALPSRLPRRTRLQLLGAVAFGGVLGPSLLLFGLRLASSASVALWLNLELATTALLGFIFFHDRLTPRSTVAALGTLAAAALLSMSEGVAGLHAGLFVLAACLCWGMDNHLTALIDGISPAQTTFWKGAVAGTVNLALGLLVAPLHASLPILALGLAVGALAYGLSIVLYIFSAQQLGATRGQIIFSSSPFFAVLLSAMFLAESISLLQFAAMAIIAGSIALLIVERHAHPHPHAAVTHAHWHRHDDDHHAHAHRDPGQPAWHSHGHAHATIVHAHAHRPDLHHRHDHDHDHGSPASEKPGHRSESVD